MKSFIRFTVLTAVAAAALFFSGCASVPMATAAVDAKAKEFKPTPERASVYIYRNENFGAAIPMTVSVNKRTLGQTAAKTYFLISVLPGRYSIESITENVSSLNLNVDAGRNYFVWQEVKMGMWSARSALQQVDEAKGKAGILESKQIASSIPDSDLAPTDAPSTPPAPASPTEALGKELKDLDALREKKSITEAEYQKMRAAVIEKYQK